MEAVEQQAEKKPRKALVKALGLVAFIVVAICIIRFTSIISYLAPEALGRFLEMAGIWAPVLYIVIYAVGVCLFIPGTLLTGLGAGTVGAGSSVSNAPISQPEL